MTVQGDMSTQEQLDKAIAAHAAWKGKFRSFMKGELELDPVVVEKCDQCEFGKWLEGPGRGDLGQSFAEVHAAHAAFHTVAATVVRRKKGGDVAGAEEALGMTGAFSKASANLSLLVVAVRNGSWKAA